MPANENTWRNLPSLHLVFGLSSVALLLSTVWMLAADHDREWKDYQNDFRSREQATFAWRADEQRTLQYENEVSELEKQLAEARASAPDSSAAGDFRDAVLVQGAFQASAQSVEAASTAAPGSEAGETKPAAATPSVDDDAVKAESAAPAGDNSKLSKEELPPEVQPLFETLDADQSKFLDPDELFNALHQTRAAADAQTRLELYDRLAPLRAWLLSLQPEVTKLDVAYTQLTSSTVKPEDVPKLRKEYLEELNHYVIVARDAHKLSARVLKFRRSDRDAVNSLYQLAVTGGKSDAELLKLKADVSKIEEEIARLVLREQQANAYRKRLETIQGQMLEAEKTADRLLKTKRDELAALEAARDARSPNLLENPIIDAFNSPIKIEQLWCPDLKINYNLAWVSRFDRCITCHQGITKTMPGSPTEPAFPIQQNDVAATLLTPAKRPLPREGDAALGIDQADLLLRRAYGMDLAPTDSSLEPAVIRAVWSADSAARNNLPASAAKAELQAGDVIKEINGNPVTSRDAALRYLLETATWGQPLTVKVQRGAPHPFASHPRLDLFLSSGSPHPKETFGCTVCHQGQGSATAFKWASHSPNTPTQKADWETKGLGWFSNHDWPFHMYPHRFVESGCLKCHHEVTELQPSERFPEPPAPKVVQGFNVIQDFGCFGCHEINGYDGPNIRVGPDMRAEPTYFAAAQQLLADPWLKADPSKLPAEEQAVQASLRNLAQQVAANPDQTDLRKKLSVLVAQDQDRAKAKEGPAPLLASASHAMVSILGADDETPGKYRKVGPSLRHVAEKVDETFLYDWIKRPSHFRPSTKMPQFFGLHNHLASPDAVTVEDWKGFYQVLSAGSKQQDTPAGYVWKKLPDSVRNTLKRAQNPTDLSLEAVEHVQDGLNILQNDPKFFDADAFASLPVSGDLAVFLSVDGDKKAVLKRSLADLSIREVEWLNRLLLEAVFPKQLNKTTSKLDEAFRYEPIEVVGVSRFLLNASQTLNMEEPPQETGDVEKGRILFQTRGCLACHTHDDEKIVKSTAGQGPNLSQLGGKLTGPSRKKWLFNWIKHPNRYHARTVMPEVMNDPVYVKKDSGYGPSNPDQDVNDVSAYLLSFADWKAVKLPLANPDAADEATLNEMVQVFLGKTIGNHDLAAKYLKTGIPEDLRNSFRAAELLLIGEPSNEKKLMYVGYKAINRLGCAGCHDIPGFEDAKPIGTGLNAWGRKETSQLAFEQISAYLGLSHGGGHEDHAHGHDPHVDHRAPNPDQMGSDGESPDDVGYYADELSHHHRAGFIWQKLRAPRSYDYKMTTFKPYEDRLRMPKFSFTPEQREAVITFVLGLVAEPTAAKAERYVYNADPRQKAVLEGRRVLEKFNCAGCHTMKMDKWLVEYDPKQFAAAQEDTDSPFWVAPISGSEDYPRLHPYFTPAEAKSSEKTDRRGLSQAVVTAVKNPQEVEDEDGNFYYLYELWEPAMLAGKVIRATQSIALRDKQVNPKAFEPQVLKYWPPDGGHFTRLVQPLIVELDRTSGAPAAKKDADALAWLPPPLYNEGAKVQTEWLYQFLLQPFPIRPATALRMPKFNMSSEDARALANYFAAVEGQDFPYIRLPQRESLTMASHQPSYLGGAFKIVADAKAGCTQCHHVGDYMPATDPKAHGPNLSAVYERLRPEYLSDWISRPKELLPYTGMPSNFPLDSPKFQDYFQGTPQEQITAVRDLLMNYDRYIQSLEEVSAKKRVAAISPPAEAAPAQPGVEAPAKTESGTAESTSQE